MAPDAEQAQPNGTAPSTVHATCLLSLLDLQTGVVVFRAPEETEHPPCNIWPGPHYTDVTTNEQHNPNGSKAVRLTCLLGVVVATCFLQQPGG